MFHLPSLTRSLTISRFTLTLSLFIFLPLFLCQYVPWLFSVYHSLSLGLFFTLTLSLFVSFPTSIFFLSLQLSHSHLFFLFCSSLILSISSLTFSDIHSLSRLFSQLLRLLNARRGEALMKYLLSNGFVLSVLSKQGSFSVRQRGRLLVHCRKGTLMVEWVCNRRKSWVRI